MPNTSLASSFTQQTDNERLQRSKITCSLAVFFYLFGGAMLDYVIYPDNFFELLNIRLIVCAVLIGIYILRSLYGAAEDVGFYIEILWPIIIIASICWIIYIEDGAASTYHAGINATLLGAMLLFLLTLQGAFWIVLITIALYTLAIFPTINEVSISSLVNNYYFLLLTGVIACVASYLNERKRFTQYSLRYELRQRNKELAELDRIKSDFFANISHELRTPLTLILSPIEDLLHSKQPFDFKVNQTLSTVRDNSYRLLKLVNDLLSVIRLDEQNAALDCEPLDLKSLLRSVIQSMQHLASKQQINLKSNMDFEPAVINGNTSSLEKIFINLLNNAIKFTPENGEIQVSTQTGADGISISIKDTGIGISEQDLPHIFERFKQADSSATRKYQGTGLGLSLVHELTLALKGNIKVESELGKGTNMTLFFPTIDAEPADQNNTTTNLQKSKNTENNPLEKIHQKADYSLQLNKPNTAILEPLQKNDEISSEAVQAAKLLIVEDEPDLRSYLVNSLSDNYQVFSAADGESGLALVMKHKPDLALLDLMLPKLDGIQLCKKIKSNEQLQTTKVILLTARIDEESKLRALKNGADDFLTKPFSTVEVKTRLDNLWKSGQLERHLEAQNQQLRQALDELKAMESKLIHSEKLSAIGSLAAGLLHEVNNPLNYALTAVQILQRDPGVTNDEDLKELVDDIFEGMDRIKVIVKDLHTFAYPSNADKEQPFRLTDAVRSAIRFTASEHKGVIIDVNILEDIITLGSNNHIVQVLINLITNASKAIAQKTDPKISISAQPLLTPDTSDKPERILITVRDNGSGISDEIRSHIFEPFYTTRDVGEGLGMGLSICYTIIENHGGSIQVKSEVDKYTEFSFDLARS